MSGVLVNIYDKVSFALSRHYEGIVATRMQHHSPTGMRCA